MITPRMVETFKKMFAVVVDAPEITLERDDACTYDDPVLMIGKGRFWIRETEVERKSILGVTKVPGFVLEAATYRAATRWEPEEHDYAEVFSDQNFFTVATEAVKAYVDWKCGNIFDNDCWEQQYEDYQKERAEIAQAEQEGRQAYEKGEKVNPYPYGIAHYYAWSKGWNAKEYEVTIKAEEQG